MRPIVTLTGRACPLPISNVDTDQLIPARFMGARREEGYGRFLLHDLRRDAAGELDPTFPINDPAYAGAEILVSHRNFGGGSSREAAVYTVVDFGFRAVIAPSFGDIFAQNAVKNGLLPARVDESAANALTYALAAEAKMVTVDLPSQTIRWDEVSIDFSIEHLWKEQLLHGWDDIDLTLRESSSIDAFRTRQERHQPWILPER